MNDSASASAFLFFDLLLLANFSLSASMVNSGSILALIDGTEGMALSSGAVKSFTSLSSLFLWDVSSCDSYIVHKWLNVYIKKCVQFSFPKRIVLFDFYSKSIHPIQFEDQSIK